MTLVVEGDVAAVKQAVEAGSTMAYQEARWPGECSRIHIEEIRKIVAISASRFKGKGEAASGSKMLGQDPPDFNIKEQMNK